MPAIVGCLDIACIGASLGIVALALAEREELIAYIGVLALGVEWSVYGAAQCSRTIVIGDWVRWSCLVVRCWRSQSIVILLNNL